MFTTEDYLYGWLLYILGGLVFFCCWWYLTAKVRLPELRLVLRVGALATMFTPWYADPSVDYLAPAVLIAGVEGIFEGNFWRAGGPLLVSLGFFLTVTLLVALGLRLKNRGSRAAPSGNSAAPTADAQ